MKILTSDNKRSELVKKNAFYGIIVKGISIIISLMLVPLTIDYVNSEMYGIWLTLSTIIHWIGFFDIGFGLGLRNKLGESLAINDLKKGKVLVSSTYFVLSSIFIPLGFSLYYICPYINWADFLNVSASLNSTLSTCARIVLVSLCFTLILKVIQNVLQAYQLNVYASIIETSGSFVSLIAIYVLTKTTFPSLVYLAYAYGGAPVLVLIIFTLALFRHRFKEIRPNIKFVDFHEIKSIFNLGGQFFVIQIACLVLYQTTNVFISRMCGSEDVTIYNVTYKYINVAVMVLNIITAPLWSAYTDAYAREDWKWIKNSYNKVKTIYGLVVIGIIIMVVVSPFVFRLWLGDSVDTSLTITMLIAVYMVLYAWSSIQSVLLNGVGKIRLQLYVSVLQTIIFFILAIVLGERFSLFGILMAMIIALTLPVAVLSIQVSNILKGNTKGIWNK